ANTFLLTHRVADLAVVFGLALLGVSMYAALALEPMYLGWWLGHGFELLGIAVIGASTAYDLRRGRGSQTLTGTLRAGDIVRTAGATCWRSSAASTSSSNVWSPGITSGSTAPGTRTGSGPTSSISRRGSSPSATSTTRSSRLASTAMPGRTARRSSSCAATAS